MVALHSTQDASEKEWGIQCCAEGAGEFVEIGEFGQKMEFI